MGAKVTAHHGGAKISVRRDWLFFDVGNNELKSAFYDCGD